MDTCKVTSETLRRAGPAATEADVIAAVDA